MFQQPKVQVYIFMTNIKVQIENYQDKTKGFGIWGFFFCNKHIQFLHL